MLEQQVHPDSNGATTMNTNYTEGSATIYEFPTRVGVNAGAQNQIEPKAAQFESARFGSGWYHEAAVGAEQATWRGVSDVNASKQTPAAAGHKRPHLYLV
jgi:hypothetical protein